MSADIAPRFWAKVDKRGPDECWNWTAFRSKGYGRIITPTGGKRGKVLFAHRLSWEMANGAIADGLFVCHRCDNPSCVNPGHLFLGTNDDNMRDMHAKGRGVQLRGVEHGRALFTNEQIADIRARRLSGEVARTVAASHGCSIATIRDIEKRRTWKHLP